MKKHIISFITLLLFVCNANSEDLIVQDFELFTIGSKLSVFNNKPGTATIKPDPNDANNKVLHFTTTAWDAFPIIKINIPSGVKIHDYDAVAFDLYRIGAENSYQQMGIYFGNKLFHKDENFIIQSPKEKWTEKKYNFDGFTYSANNYTMALGIASANCEYYIDNIRLVKYPFIGYDIDDDNDVLRYWAEKNSKYIGMAVGNGDNGMNNFYSVLWKDQNMHTKALYRNFNMLVAGNEMKVDALQPQQGVFNFSKGDTLVKFTQKHNMKLRGHTLLWHSQLPAWMGAGEEGKYNYNNYNREQLLEIMENHITTVVSHFKGKVHEWDVVNEVISDGDGSLRKSIWSDVIGSDFIDSAFVYAHRADPDAILYINDYGVEMMGYTKADALFKKAVELKKKGIPIHGVGMQTHITKGQTDFTKMNNNVKRYAKEGLKCIITELDIALMMSEKDDQISWEEQAREYAKIIRISLFNDNCPNVVIWGLMDDYSWIDGHSKYTKTQPLIFTGDMVAKPSFYTIRDEYEKRAIANSIDEVNTEQPKSHGPITVYSIMGIEVCRIDKLEDVNLLPSGIYILNNKKVIVSKK